MKTPIAAVLAACLASACSSTPQTQRGSPVFREVAFVCSGGEQLSVRFFPAQGVAVLVRHGVTIELQQLPSGSGFLYSDGRYTVRGKGDDLNVEIGRMAPLECKAR